MCAVQWLIRRPIVAGQPIAQVESGPLFRALHLDRRLAPEFVGVLVKEAVAGIGRRPSRTRRTRCWPGSSPRCAHEAYLTTSSPARPATTIYRCWSGTGAPPTTWRPPRRRSPVRTGGSARITEVVTTQRVWRACRGSYAGRARRRSRSACRGGGRRMGSGGVGRVGVRGCRARSRIGVRRREGCARCGPRRARRCR